MTAPLGRVAVILPQQTNLSTESVKVIFTGAIKAAEDPEIGKAVYGLLEAALNKGVFVPNKIKVIPNGLLGVNEGFELGRKHKVINLLFIFLVHLLHSEIMM